MLIAGRDPFRSAGGAESYMLGHAQTARFAGFPAHMFVLGDTDEVRVEDCCVLHRVATPMRPILATSAVLHRRWLDRALFRFLCDKPGRHIIHAHGGWSYIATRVAHRLAGVGVEAIPVGTFFTSAEHGEAAKYRGALVQANPALRLAHALQLVWVRNVSAWAERRGYRDCAAVTINYESVRKLLGEAYGPRPGVVRLAYAAATAFGPDQLPVGAPYSPPQADQDEPLIVAVSRHSARKGLDVLIRALGELRDQRVPFRACLVGEGTLLAAHRKLVRSLRLDARVSLPGRVPDVMPYLRACDVFVLPSTEEGSGSMSVLEALQAGAAIVSADVDGMPEDLSHGVNALLVAPGSQTELSRAIRRLLEDPALRNRLGSEARALYERRFSPAVAARSLGDFYASLGLSRESG